MPYSLIVTLLKFQFGLLFLFTLSTVAFAAQGGISSGNIDTSLIIDDDILLTTADGANLSVLVVRPTVSEPLPVALNFTIYANKERKKDIDSARFAVSKGYIGVIGYARGKHLSNSQPQPYETEVNDVNVIIDWLSKQPWSDGRVAMYGGSYDGFSQWAAVKNPHPALKTIVPYVAAIPGYGLPMENGIFLNANYGWPFHVTNNRYMDTSIYQQRERFSKMNANWFKSGQPYRNIDRFDIRSNYALHKWLDHPDYDEYWQSMLPIGQEYAKVNIPVLSITGYFDDGQVSALRYLQRHEQFNPDADHFLVIGPYDHWTAQRQPGDKLRDIQLDPVAKINVPELTFQWLDHILKKTPRPKLIKDKINFQVMGTNQWHSAPSLQALNQQTKRFFLHQNGILKTSGPDKLYSTPLRVDLTNREKQNHYYPWPIVNEQLDTTLGLVFESAPFEQDMIYAGQFSASLSLKLNRKDADLNMVVYELTPDNQYVHLSYYLGRASYASDISRRALLAPDTKTSIAVSGTRMNGKLIPKGSKLVVLVGINKNDFAQVNYGTGKDVSEESIEDAKSPLLMDLFTDSYIDVPISRAQ